MLGACEAMHYTSIKFGVGSSSHFPFKARTQTEGQTSTLSRFGYTASVHGND